MINKGYHNTVLICLESYGVLFYFLLISSTLFAVCNLLHVILISLRDLQISTKCILFDEISAGGLKSINN